MGKKNLEIKETLTKEEAKKLRVVNVKKMHNAFDKVDDELKEAAMPDGGAVFYAYEFPNKGEEHTTFSIGLNGCGNDVIDLLVQAMRKDPMIKRMLQEAVKRASNPLEDLLNMMQDFRE